MKREVTYLSLKERHWYYLLSFFVAMSLLGLIVAPLLAGFHISLEDIKHIRLPWLAACLGAAALVVSIDALRLKVLLAQHSERLGFFASVKIVLIYAFFSALTPTSFGGELSMIYLLKRQGLQSGTATSSTVARALLPLIILLPVFPIASILVPDTLPHYLSHSFRVFALVSATLIGGFLFLRLERRAFGDAIPKEETIAREERGLKKFFWALIGGVWKFYREVEDAFADMVTYGWFNNVKIVLLTAAHLFAMYSLGPLAAKMFGLNVPFFKGILTLCMVHLIVYVSPSPAGSGVAEAVFGVAFKPFIETSGFLVVAFWRFFSEYGRVLAGAVLTFIHLHSPNTEEESPSPEGQTLS